LSVGKPVADPSDRTPPTAPSDLQVQAVTPESVVLSWQASNDGNRWVPGGTGVPVAGYVVTRNGAEMATVTSTSFEDRARSTAKATGATSITYSVTAVDASGNRSPARTLVVDLPGSGRSPALVMGAVALLALAGILTIGVLLYRHSVARRARLPRTPRPVSREDRTRTPVG
jgi:hypothetical protein